MKKLTNYDPNISWAKHTIKVSFMIWDYKVASYHSYLTEQLIAYKEYLVNPIFSYTCLSDGQGKP
ncbi:MULTISPECIES: DUF5406 family protein [Enterococcus]|uniref:DUF5406 family protein n=1 Tax=Enterococcus TaxID=1350 RepID=UPI001571954D|nr:DUF5406 family protein [Enterococcus faecium]MBX4202570.1 DUF5406 domain-containing protein [Enterococcus faecium]NSN21322.1 DUF5406 family protein [Enterococcus faecalis]NSP63246.1 DUF5406 family protein [Enterococcus faecalis]